MGLSKLFPCCRKPKPQAQETSSDAEANGASSNAKIRPVADIPNESSNNAEAPKQEMPAKAQDKSELNISQKVWNRAYDELAESEATKSLVEDYMMAVQKANKPDEDVPMSTIKDNMAKMDSQVDRENILRNTVQSGKEKIYKSTKLTNAVGGVSEFVLKFKSVIDLAVGTNPQAALPWAGVCIGLQFLLNPSQESKSNEAGIGYVISRMEWYTSLTDHVLSRENIVIGNESFEDVHRQLESRVTELYKALLLYQMKSACSYYRSQGWTFIRNTINLDDWNSQLDSVKEAESAVGQDSKQYNKAKVQSFLGEIVRNGQKSQEILSDFHQTLQDYIASQSKKALGEDYDGCLKDLYVVNPQAQMSSIQGKKDTLIPEAFKWILNTTEYQSFTDWSDESTCQVLWLNGPAGTGKTMLMIGIIMELYKQSKLAPGVSYFFCVADDKTNNSAMDALRSLIWLLLLQQPHLISHLVETHKRSGSAMFHGPTAFYSLRDTFKDMLADENLSPVYLAFDALDECAEGTPGVNDLLQLIAETIKPTWKASKKIKWILSSRPEIEVYNKLKHANGVAVRELDVLARKEPVDAYITYKLSQLQIEHNYTQDNLDIISAELNRHEQITFLWVALVLKDLTSGNVKQRKAVEHVKGTPSSLSAIYDRMMVQIDKTEDEEDREFCKKLLEAICFASRPLSYAEVPIIAGLPSDATDDIVQICGSFLTCHDDTIHILHNSTRQHLTTYFGSHHKGGAGQIHESMAKRSISAMSDSLRYNICGINEGTELADAIGREKNSPLTPLRYSCEFWVDHLCEPEARGLGDDQLLDNGAAFEFLEEHFLHWLEGLSLIRKLPTALSSVQKLITNLKKTPDMSPKFSSFLKDAERFVLANLSIIEKVPLQTYGAALAFSPNKSEMKTRYWNERLPSIRKITGIRDNWDPCLQTQVPVDGLERVLFSPDGKFYASASSWTSLGKGVVQLWDTETGLCTRTLKLEKGQVNSFSISPDNNLLASVSSCIVQVWDLSTGACTLRFNLFNEEKVQRYDSRGDDDSKSIVFANDGDALAVSYKDTVEIWDISTEKCTKALYGHTGDVTSVAFSPDGKTIASASEGGNVKLWDYPAVTCQRTLEECNNPRAVLFSPDGTKLATVNGDDTGDLNESLTVWELPGGTYTHTIGPDPVVEAAAFTSDSKAFVIASPLAGKIHLLDVTTGARIKSFNAGLSVDVSVCPTKGLVVSATAPGYDGGLLRVWDTTNICEESPVGHDQRILTANFSPDGESIATGSMDRTVKLWSIADRTCTQTLEGHSERVEHVAFSPDSKIIASGVFDGSVRIWDRESGSYIHIPGLNGEKPELGSPFVAISGDGRVLVTASRIAVKVWDPITGACKQTLDNDQLNTTGIQPRKYLSKWLQTMTGVVLSHDGQTLLLTTRFDGCQVIDLATGTWTQSLRSSDKPPIVASPEFSTDGKTCALLNEKKELELWDTATWTFQEAIPYSKGCQISSVCYYCETSRGPYKLDSGVLITSADSELSLPALYSDGEWAIRGDERILWLPPDYRGPPAVLGRDALMLTNINGQVIFVDVN
ncbi:unnamed protein product [Penicillium pancosmium]